MLSKIEQHADAELRIVRHNGEFRTASGIRITDLAQQLSARVCETGRPIC